MAMPKILVIDDNSSVGMALEVLFALHGIDVESVTNANEGAKRIQRGDIDLVIQDMNFGTDTTSGIEGIVLFHELRALSPDMPIILLTAWTHLEHAVALVKAGAADYIAKPWDDNKLVASALTLIELHDLQRASVKRRRAREERHASLRRHYDLREFVFADEVSEQALTLACQVAKSPLPVLIQGPSGAGKDRLAQLIHANSSVSHGPMVSLNCGALPEDLIESELFGAEAGAFAGVTKARSGKLESADGGTLFLDEIAALTPESQTKLLRAIETGKFSRLGSTRERHVNLRILAATSADVDELVRTGKFRKDLLYRINGVTVNLKPLKDRTDDILPLARYFLPSEKVLSEAAEQALMQYDWPGNVRELKTAIQRAAVLATGDEIAAEHLMLPSRVALSDANEPTAADVRAALSKHRGVIAQAAAELGLSRQALYRRMSAHGIARE